MGNVHCTAASAVKSFPFPHHQLAERSFILMTQDAFHSFLWRIDTTKSGIDSPLFYLKQSCNKSARNVPAKHSTALNGGMRFAFHLRRLRSIWSFLKCPNQGRRRRLGSHKRCFRCLKLSVCVCSRIKCDGFCHLVCPILSAWSQTAPLPSVLIFADRITRSQPRRAAWRRSSYFLPAVDERISCHEIELTPFFGNIGCTAGWFPLK